MHVGDDARDLNVEVVNLLNSLLLLKILVHRNTAGRRCPGMITYILLTVTKKIKVGEECILNYIIPCEVGLAGGHCICGGIVVVEGGSDGLVPCLECFRNVFAKFVTL